MLAGKLSWALTLALAAMIASYADARVNSEERASGARALAFVTRSSGTTNPATSRRTTRRLGAVTIVEQDDAKLTDVDVRGIQSVLAPKRACATASPRAPDLPDDRPRAAR